MKHLFRFSIAFATVAIFSITSCQKANDLDNSVAATDHPSDFLRAYYTLQCKITKETPGFFPPQAARSFGYVGLASYESVVHGIDGAQSLAGQLNGLSANALPQPDPELEYNWQIVCNAAVAETMRKMFELKITPENLADLNWMEEANYNLWFAERPLPVAERSVEFGKAIAAAIYQYSMTDGGHESYLDAFQLPYQVPVGSYCWVPTGPALQPISPYWGECRPFLAVNVTTTQPPSPKEFSTDPNSDFYAEAMEVVNQVNNNTPEQQDIARFWADDPFNTCTPAGHTFNILTQLLEENDASLAKAAVAYGMLAIGENDAFISCWKSKYSFDLIRPVTYIKQYIDPNFTTVIGTPPFPAYSSGHSCEIGVGQMVFTHLFTNGDGAYELADRTGLQYGFGIRNFSNFADMAEECANSRFYGGIHFPMDNQEGLNTGRSIGQNVHNLIAWPSVD